MDNFERIIRQGGNGQLPPELQRLPGMTRTAMVAIVQEQHWYNIEYVSGKADTMVPVMGTVSTLHQTLHPMPGGITAATLLKPEAIMVWHPDQETMESKHILWHAIATLTMVRPFNEREKATAKRRWEKEQERVKEATP